MNRHPARPLRIPLVDLETVRETLAYIHDDLSRVTGLEKASAALGQALAELAAAEPRRQTVSQGILGARFLKRPRH